ncbi:Lysine methyltransferase [Phytophthora infestans]|uniref:Lysine methyltransferase n=1 Tax=Phytophthora infestans TaxID=4787 RepID=A0A833WCW8_PHYIN|nr:Lysine methyltransferase [Phytophthora infestans]
MDSSAASVNDAAVMEDPSGFSDEIKASPLTAASALVPFSFRSPFHDALRDATRWFPIAGTSKRIRIDQAWQSDGRGGTSLGFGASVYDAAIALSLYLASHPDLIKGGRVIELGCGPGLVGVVAAHLEPKSIVITDGDSASVALTQRNIKANDLSEDVCTAEEYLWGDLEHHLVSSNAKYDVILGADIVACPYASAFESLMVSLQQMAGPKTLILLAYKSVKTRKKNSSKRLKRYLKSNRLTDRSYTDFQEGGDIMIFKGRLKNQS